MGQTRLVCTLYIAELILQVELLLGDSTVPLIYTNYMVQYFRTKLRHNTLHKVMSLFLFNFMITLKIQSMLKHIKVNLHLRRS